MGLREDVMHEPVSSLAVRPVLSVNPEHNVREVVARMKQAQIGCAIVVDKKKQPIGKFTERLLVRILARDPALLDEPIERHVIDVDGCVTQTDPIVRVIEVMQQTGLRFVCVANSEGRIVGLTGQKSLMAYIAEHFPRQVKSNLMESKLHMDFREGA